MMPVTRTHRFGWTLAVASALLCTTQVAAQPMQGRGERAPPFPSTWEAAVRRTVLSPSGLATQISPPGGPLRPRVGEAQKKGLRWGAGIGALAGLTLGIVAAENRECGMDCLLGTPVALPIFGAIGGMMGGSAIGFVVGSVIDHRRASRAYVAVSLPLGRP